MLMRLAPLICALLALLAAACRGACRSPPWPSSAPRRSSSTTARSSCFAPRSPAIRPRSARRRRRSASTEALERGVGPDRDGRPDRGHAAHRAGRRGTVLRRAGRPRSGLRGNRGCGGGAGRREAHPGARGNPRGARPDGDRARGARRGDRHAAADRVGVAADPGRALARRPGLRPGARRGRARARSAVTRRSARMDWAALRAQRACAWRGGRSACSSATSGSTFALRRFPYTRPWAEALLEFLLDVLGTVASGIAHAIPGLVFVVGDRS